MTQHQGISGLLVAIEDLSLATSLGQVQEIVLKAARALTGCDGATFVLRDGAMCFYADQDAIAPLWKGTRVPIASCISGWAMLHNEPVVIADIYLDDRILHEAYQPTFVRSLAMMPVRAQSPLGALGVYWAREHTATDQEVGLLRALAEATSLALDKASVRDEIQDEVGLAEKAYLSAQTDELTGLLNRRGFASAAAERADAGQGGVAFVDVNGLKEVNDAEGRLAGDMLIRRVAAILRGAVRDVDIVGRLGGDEFAVYAPGDDPTALRNRLAAALGDTASIGTAPHACVGDLSNALLLASAGMYEAKRATRVGLAFARTS